MEIGSEFWINKMPEDNSNVEIPNWLSRFGSVSLTSSGRGAISLLLHQITPQNKSVLLPEYICESVITPFIEFGYTCYFYQVDINLCPIVKDIEIYEHVGVFLHMGYYGFQTNSNLSDILSRFRINSTIVIEDVTHNLFSSFNNYIENNFIIGSIRKWFGIPSGGFVASTKDCFNKPSFISDEFSSLRMLALINKGKYMKSNDQNLKKEFLFQFSKAEELLNEDSNPYKIDALSMKLIQSLDVDELVNTRRVNFRILLKGLGNINNIKVPFKQLENNQCPFFFPIMINGNRDEIRKKLINEQIYCPIHWPIPDQVNDGKSYINLEVYSNILSIPCDQRYGIVDMERIISVLKKI